MQSNENKIWFPTKKYGWGWGLPNCWQGWVVLTAYLVMLFGGAFLISTDSRLYIAYAAVLSVILIIICYFKGEKPRWRWGKD
jgi:lipoprotein signal peptidase